MKKRILICLLVMLMCITGAVSAGAEFGAGITLRAVLDEDARGATVYIGSFTYGGSVEGITAYITVPSGTHITNVTNSSSVAAHAYNDKTDGCISYSAIANYETGEGLADDIAAITLSFDSPLTESFYMELTGKTSLETSDGNKYQLSDSTLPGAEAVLSLSGSGSEDSGDTETNKCGDNLTWKIASNTLTISGTGNMYDYNDSDNKAPWLSWNFTSVVISNGVTGIGDYAFYNSPISRINISSSVTDIKNTALKGCDSLEYIIVDSSNANYRSANNVLFDKAMTTIIKYPAASTASAYSIPNTVTSIAPEAFAVRSAANSTLKSVEITEGVTEIGNYAFAKSGITSAVIPSSVKTIGDYAFSSCENITNLSLVEGISSIGAHAFEDCYALPSVSVPSSVESIGEGAFEYCTAMTNLTLKDGLKVIGSHAFCNCRALLGIKIPGTVESMGEYAFECCENLITAQLGEGVKSIGGAAFWECNSLESVTIPSSLENILSYREYYDENDPTFYEEHGVFEGCALKSITLNEGLKTLGNYTFSGCPLEEVTIYSPSLVFGSDVFGSPDKLTIKGLDGSSAQAYASMNNYTFEVIEKPVVVTPSPSEGLKDNDSGQDNGITWVYNNGTLNLIGTGKMANYTEGQTPWYKGKNQITKIIIGNGITAIGNNTFAGLSKLEEVSFPSGLGAIGENAFKDCQSLSAVELPSTLSSIASGAFRSCTSLKELTVPKNTEAIMEKAFEGCTDLTSVSVPFVGLMRGSDNSFSYIFGEVPQSLKSIAVTDSQTIPAEAFANLPYIESVTINDGVTDIGKNAFKNCVSLKAFTIPSAVTKISEGLFDGCESIVSVSVHNSISEIGKNAFRSCKKLLFVNIPDGIKTINEGTFENCQSLTVLSIPDSVTDIAKLCLAGTSSLHELSIPFTGISANDTKNIFPCIFGTAAADVPDSLKKVTVTNDIYIAANDFKDCGKIEEITIVSDNSDLKRHTESIGSSAFENCASLKMLSIEDDLLTYIGNSICLGCDSLEAITVPFVGSSRTAANSSDAVFGYFFGSSDTNIQGKTTQQDYSPTGTKYYYIPKTLNDITVTKAGDISYGAFMNLMVENITLTFGAKIGEKAFYNCQNLKRVILPEDLSELGYEAFYNCSNLIAIRMPSNDKSIKIGDYAFYGCPKLETAIIPANVASMEEETFKDCSNLTIYGYADSYAQQYANSNNIHFSLLSVGDDLDKIFYGDTPVPGQKTVITAQLNNGSCNISLSSAADGTIYVATYGFDNSLKEIKSVPTGNKTEFTVPVSAENALCTKVLLWDSEMQPLADCVRK